MKVTYKFTTNEAIVLLDCYRGFDASNHVGTLENDLKKLCLMGYVRWSGRTELSSERFAWEPTEKGRTEVHRMVVQEVL